MDRAVSAASFAGREALHSLLAAAQRKPRPFDRILVDDTSRLARNIGDALRSVEVLSFHGVGVSFVTQGIDSLVRNARQLPAMNGIMDEQYLVGLAEKVHRGQEGRALRGLNPGGKLFGYVNVPIADPSRMGKYGRPAVLGVEQQILPEQAKIVVRIFRMYAEGSGLARIAKMLNEEKVPSPQPPRTRAIQAWCPSSLRELLRNELYQGVRVWNRTIKIRNPTTGRKTSKPRPEHEWKRAHVPHLRIVPEALWNAVQARIVHVKSKFGAARLGGLSRAKAGRTYLFSGSLVCGTCGSRLVIISGRGVRGYVRYGCPSHRYRGVCANALTIRQDRLEEQLLHGLEERLVSPQILDDALGLFQQRLAELRRQAGSVEGLQQQRRELQAKAERLTDAIAETGHSPSLLSRLGQVEAAVAAIEKQMEATKPVNISVTTEEIRKCVSTNIRQLRALLRQDVTGSREALGRHLGQLVLTPTETPNGPVYAVAGGISLETGTNVMPTNSVPGHQENQQLRLA